MIMMATI